MPASLAGLAFGFQDNQITGIEQANYDPSLVDIKSQCGSDSILCPLKTWNVSGKRASDDTLHTL